LRLQWAIQTIILGILLSYSSHAQTSNPIINLNERCAVEKIRELCPKTCADLCGADRDFLIGQTEYCLSVLPPKPQPAADTMDCEKVIPPAGENHAAKQEEMDCTKITDPFERAECEDQFPDCAANTPELIGRSQLLIDQINSELEKYTVVLEKDFGDIGNKATLCGFTRDELKKYYGEATNDTSIISSLQSKAHDIEACGKQVEDWITQVQLNSTDDALQDDLIRETKKDLQKLDPLRINLNVSVKKLQEAGPKIYGVIRLYNRFCERKSKIK
jgi:hypothetical protein